MGTNITDRLTFPDKKEILNNYTFFEITHIDNPDNNSYVMPLDGVLGLGYMERSDSPAISLIQALNNSGLVAKRQIALNLNRTKGTI